ncbi:MAG: zinc-dependent peptidase [Burkholderiales bacterium]|nr:zinc-dependent peptidase [Burkholderiales bacterium]
MAFSFDRWRRARILKKTPVDDALWQAALGRYRFLAGLDGEETARLRERVTVFLHDKEIHGAGGLALDAAMRLSIAVQACILVLNLPPRWYDGWVEVIVYPDEFMPDVEWEDEYGVVHAGKEIRSGEAWLQGPVILSWADVGEDYADGINVAIHEFAHKLDMLNGDADGYPPLHEGMSRAAWTSVFKRAFEDFARKVDSGEDIEIDPYAAESPGEFFAVLSESFFERPEVLRARYPSVYGQLAAFYRQDPYARHQGAGLLPEALE